MADLTITADLLTRGARRNCYPIPSTGMVFFGIRGLKPELPIDTTFASSRAGNFVPVDFRRMNCTLGQWKVDTGEIAVFPGSTVPSLPNIIRAKEQGGSGTNMLMLGRYEHEKGIHKPSKPGGHRAFRQATFFPVWRTVDNLTFDLSDKLDLGSDSGDFVWDNLHSAYTDSLDGAYSSAGCQVVCGLPRSAARDNQPETGPWRTFVENAYALQQNRFVYLLFSAEELALLDKAENAKDMPQVVRFGSSGQPVKDVQTALAGKGILQSEADGEFGRDSLRALMAFQTRSVGPAVADGVCGANTAALLGVTLPTLSKAKPAPQPSQPTATPTGGTAEPEDETDLDEATLQRLRVLILGLSGAQPILTTTTVVTPPPHPTTVVAPPHPTTVVTPPPHPTTAVAPPPPPVQSAAERSRANFERAQALIKEFEGGFVDDPRDPGGATNFGITHTTLANWRKRPVTTQDVRNMSYEEAKDIYFSEYWSNSACGGMPGPLALPVYNVAVHAGPGRAADFLLRSLNQNGASLTGGNRIDDVMLAAVTKAPIPDVISDFIDLYEAKLRAHPNFAHFKTGFLRRVNKLRTESEKWLAETGGDQPVTPTPRLDDEREVAVNTKEDLLAELVKILAPAATLPSVLTQPSATTPPAVTSQPGVAPPGSAMPQDQADAIAALLRQLLGSGAGQPGLTPVNGALGQTIGKMLDGRKSFIGIAGALLSSLLSPTTAGALSPLAALLPGALGTILSSAAPVLLPVFLALSAWGGLGKLDKYAAQQK